MIEFKIPTALGTVSSFWHRYHRNHYNQSFLQSADIPCQIYDELNGKTIMIIFQKSLKKFAMGLSCQRP